MRIQTIEITNYKAFLGTHEIKVGGKNLFIYGENGSGKSSLYYALKDFFQSTIEDIDLAELENAFVLEDEQGKTAIKVKFKPNPFRIFSIFFFRRTVIGTRLQGLFSKLLETKSFLGGQH